MVTRRAEDVPRFGQRNVLLTGGTRGIGRALAQLLAGQGANLVLTSRQLALAEETCAEIRRSTQHQAVRPLACDLADLSSVRDAAAEYLSRHSRLDLLICNAGQYPERGLSCSADGYEAALASNHLGNALLMLSLLPRLISSAPSRVVLLTSAGHKHARADLAKGTWGSPQWEPPSRPFKRYNLSKLANMYFAAELARRVHPRPLQICAVHPGRVDTSMMRVGFASPPGRLAYAVARRFLLTPHEAAHRVLDACVGRQPDGGLCYYENGRVGRCDCVENPRLRDDVWRETLRTVDVDGFLSRDPLLVEIAERGGDAS